MSWPSSILVAFLSGVAGLFLAGMVASACVSWYQVPSREGASGFFVLFNSLGGGLAALIVGLVTARIIVANYGPGFATQLGGAIAILFVITGAAALLCRWLADVPPKIDGKRLNLEVEFRFPATSNSAKPPTSAGLWKFELVSVSGHTQRSSFPGNIQTNRLRFEAGHWIVPAEVFLYTERKRSITLQNGDTPAAAFLVPMPARPGKTFQEWSDWLPRQSQDGSPWPPDKLSYRFRVQKRLPPPSYADKAAAEAAADEAKFTALPPDAPVTKWLPYLQKPAQEERARANILARPNLAGELSELVVSKNAETAVTALRIIAGHPAADFIPPVQAAGRHIADRIRNFNETAVEADPSYEGAADVSIRFHGWMEAVRALRSSSGGDFTPEIQIILELSRVRRDSHAMQEDVCRVASYYLHQWAGIAPLPGDPKPR